MLKIVGDIFYSLPASLQNVALSFYGLSLIRNRHTGNYSRYYEEAVTRSKYNRAQLDSYADAALTETLATAVSRVPYYRQLHQAGKFPIEKVKCVADINALPILEKPEVRVNPEQFINDRFEKKTLSIVSTTGSTGTPLRIYCNADVRQRNYAFHDRFLTMSGIDKSGWRATIGGRIIIPASHRTAPFWRYSYFQKNALFSSYHLNQSNIESYIRKLRELSPEHIDSYPSSIYSIASYAKKNGISLRGITKAIVTSGETLFDDQKSTVQEQLGVNVYDQYGSAEMNVLVTSCSQGQYHVHSDFGVLEILNSNGEQAKAGEEGDVICTGFINDVMPLIRYRIGDRAIAGDRSCSCGSALPTVTRILGRDDDVVITPEGDRVGRLSPVLKGFPVKEAQYIQERIGEIRVLLVVDSTYTAQDEARLTSELRMRVGGTINIKFEYVDHIERSKGGKLKSIVSKLNKA